MQTPIPKTIRMPDAAELQRALNLLVHDLRAPLGVAQGYVRLLKDDRLSAPADRERAWTQTEEALGRIARLCKDAATFAQDPVRSVLIDVPTVEVVTRIRRALLPDPSMPTTDEVSATTMKVANLDGLVDAVRAIVDPIRARHATMGLSFDRAGDEWRCRLGTDPQRDALDRESPTPFDPWRGGQGLALVMACRHVQDLGGRIWTTASATPGVGIGLPLETR
ncbi:MAG: sensor histidine kinase [Acidobacteria bacterium]|nr:sensor histidine kinase [Acidobacteriota bacterium]